MRRAIYRGACLRSARPLRRRRSVATEIESEQTFNPLVFSSCGGMGPETSSALKRLASMAAEKRHEPYHQAITLLRMRLHFSLLRASFVCLRGTRSRPQAAPRHIPADVVMHELWAED